MLTREEASAIRTWPLSRKHRWYDFTVTVDDARGRELSQRYAGRAENGKPGVTDPAMGA